MYKATFFTKFFDGYFDDIFRRFPDLVFQIDAADLAPDCSVYMVVRIANLEANDINEVIRCLLRNPNIKNIELFEKDRNAYYFLVRKRRLELLPIIFESGCYLITPYRIFLSNGIRERIFTVISPTSLAIKRLKNKLESMTVITKINSKSIVSHYNYSISSSDFDRITSVLNGLSPRQTEALITAYEKGYFDWPRRINCEAVSRVLGISKSTFSQHLRIAEGKIFRAIVKSLQNLST